MSTNPYLDLLRGSLAYGQQDPLLTRAQTSQSAPGEINGTFSPVKLVHNAGATDPLEQVAAISSHGPRQGLAHQTYDLGNGMRANVYYDANGHRKVFTYKV